MKTKTSLRKKINKQILAMSVPERNERSERVQGRLLAAPEFKGAGCIAAYAAMPFEVDTDIVLRAALSEGKVLALPKTNWESHRMEMIRVRNFDTELVERDKGILEPFGDEAVPLEEIDLVIAPGRAFDRQCRRLGQGGGFYDAFLSALRPDCLVCALAFDIQIIDEVPVEPHDKPVNMVVSESEIYTL